MSGFYDELNVRADLITETLQVSRSSMLEKLNKESTMKRSGCFKNMDILMGKREEYNLRYREEIDLQNQSKRSRFWNIVGKKDLLCPDSGEYHSTEFGWVYCTIHGKARIISHE